MQKACGVAGLRPAEIDYINSHGTGTPLNDVAEAHAIRRWCEAAGDDPARLAVSSTKGGIGHLLGGAGAVEAVVCLMSLREQFLPPNANVRELNTKVESFPSNVIANMFHVERAEYFEVQEPSVRAAPEVSF